MYEFLRVIFTALFGKIFHAEITGLENVPLKGGLILAANHLSNWDPPFLATYIMRPVSYMAKEELFKIPLFSWAIRQCHAFPVKRGSADLSAIRAALSQLKDGKCVSVFPEGTRSKTGEVQKGEPGVALLASMAKIPVVPAAIIGTNKIFSSADFFPKLKIIYGTPMVFSGKKGDREAIRIFSEKIMDEIKNLKKKGETDNYS